MKINILKPILLTISIMITLIPELKAEPLHLTITPKRDLQSGKISEDSLLALIQISGVSDNCIINVWDGFATQEYKPGHYTLLDNSKGLDILKVKLSGENWQPNSITGKGVTLTGAGRSATLMLLSSEEQFQRSQSWSTNINAQCISNNIVIEEVNSLKSLHKLKQ